jgi:hypothetical protein
MSDELVQNVGQKISERWRFTISELLNEFPQLSCTVLNEIITVKLGCHKFFARWSLKMLTGVHKTQRMTLDLTLLEQNLKDGDEFLNHVYK